MMVEATTTTTNSVCQEKNNSEQHDSSSLLRHRFKYNQNRMTTRDELNNAVQPLLTDLYQISMAYAYWKSGKNDRAVFDLFFRKSPFQGEFTIFAGLEDCLKYIEDFRFDDSDIDYLRSAMPGYVEPAFFEYLRAMNLSELKLYAIREGSLVFPRIPMMRLEGPLAIVQLLETTLLVLVNYASLVATNAARFRLAAGERKTLLEFGLRRAQGPDGALSASKYCYVGGFDGTSNVLAGKIYGIPIRGTHAHSFVSSYLDINDLHIRTCKSLHTGAMVDVVALAHSYLKRLEKVAELHFLESECNKGELAAFTAYAISFPTNFLALVDTYNVLKLVSLSLSLSLSFFIYAKLDFFIFMILKLSFMPLGNADQMISNLKTTDFEIFSTF
jgi:nicotinate phosphoribosyltransferase